MNKDSNNEGLPTLTTEQAAELLGLPQPRLRYEAKQQEGWCYRGKWAVKKNPDKRDCWHPYKSTMPRFKAA